MKLTKTEIQEVQLKYSYLTNYESDDPDEPINPLSYVDSNGDALLHIATVAGDHRTVELLLKAGVDPNCPGDMGSTALHYARMKKFNDIAGLLVSFGARGDLENDFGQASGSS